MDTLRQLPNVGKVLANNLRQIGVDSPEQLRAMGTREAFMRIRALDPGACLQMLYGLAGAVEGVPDSQLSRQAKDELKRFFNTL